MGAAEALTVPLSTFAAGFALRWRLGLLVFSVAALVRVAACTELRNSALLHLDRWQDSEMHYVDTWARTVAGGDLLLRTPLDPPDTGFLCTPRPGKEPPAARCSDPANAAALRRWTQTPAYWQAPLYPYIVAALYNLFEPSPRLVAAFQAFLGIVSCGFAFAIAARLFGNTAAVAAGCVAALLGTGIYYQTLLLDGTCTGLAALVTIYLLLRAVESHLPCFTGVLAGIAGATTTLLSVSTALPVGAAFVAAVIARSFRRERSGTARLLAGLICGLALALAPLVARNIAVGAPRLTVAARLPVDFVMGNALGATATARVKPNATTTAIFARAGQGLDPRADIGGVIASTLATHPYGENWWWLAAEKFAAFFRWFEIPADANYYYFLEHVPILSRFLIGWSVMAGFVVLGLAAALARRVEALLLMVWVLATAAACALLFNLSLLRFPAALVATVLAGNGVATLVALERQRRYGSGLLALACVIAIDYATLATWQVPFGRIRPEYYDVVNDLAVSVAEEQASAGQTDRALAMVRKQLRAQPRALRAVTPGAELALDPWVATNARSFEAVYRSVANYAGTLGNEAEAREALRHAERLAQVVEQWRTWPGR